jgi:lysozyme
MKCDKEMIELIKEFEGLSLTAYADAGGVPTIGYGHTIGVKLGDTITKETAEHFLVSDIERTEKALDTFLKSINVSPNKKQYSALVSFTFNLGISNTRKLFGCVEIAKNVFAPTRTLNSLPDYMLLYNKCNGKKLTGLVNRRKKEVDYFEGKISMNESKETIKKIQYLVKPNFNIRKKPTMESEVLVKYNESVFVELIDNTITNDFLNTNRGYIHKSGFYDQFLL